MKRFAIFCLSAISIGLSWQPVAAQQPAPGTASQRMELGAPLKDAKLAIQRVELKSPIRVVIKGTAKEVRALIEFRINSSEAIPVRALDPVLYVGDTTVREYRHEDANTIVFTLYEPDRVKSGMPIRLQFGDQATTSTKLATLELKSLPTVQR